METKRLILRTFEDCDLDALVLMNQDPVVMEYFPSVMSREQTIEFIQKMHTHQQKYGYSMFMLELKSTHEMIGIVSLLNRVPQEFEAPFVPAIDIGWRLSLEHWGKGYATEAAQAVMTYAFSDLRLNEIVSFTTIHNKASRRVMEKVGLHYDPEGDFDHPKLALNHSLCRHVLYRLSRAEYSNLATIPFA
ncbi:MULTISPECIES: GNAT family N-acetyltransferase [Cysteiniphilum]|uniref:GNAT family N-acetyltransferase n=1 Tax=Cysteiniphilum TaxID=2056696 RepID=UPI00177F74A5|nr:MULTISPECIES: GNAT family N-acetyltransferase [Cysteiniphilum]